MSARLRAVLLAVALGAPAAGPAATTALAAEPTFSAPGAAIYHDGANPVAGITVGDDGAIWVTVPELPGLARISTAGALTEVKPQGMELPDAPKAIAPGGDGTLWFTEPLANRLGRYDPATGALADFDATTNGGQLSPNASPEQIVEGPEGHLWFSELNHAAIGELETLGDGSVKIAEHPTDGATLGITPDPGGDGVWFTELGVGGTIAHMNAAGTVEQSFERVLSPIDTTVEAPTYITAGPDGDLWFSGGYFQGYVGTITPTGTEVRYEAGIDPNSYVTAPVAGPDGNVWAIEANRDVMLRLTPSGVVTRYSRPPNLFGDFVGPMVAGPDGDLWEISEFGQVVKIDVGATDGEPSGEEPGGSEPGAGPGATPGGGSTDIGSSPGSGAASARPAPAGPSHANPKKSAPPKCKKGFQRRRAHGNAKCVKKKTKAKRKHRRSRR